MLKSTDARCVDASLTGGKGSSLAILNAVRGVVVPAFFCVSTDGFREVLRSSEAARGQLAKLQEISDLGGVANAGSGLSREGSNSEKHDSQRELFKAAAVLRSTVEALPFPPAVAKEIKGAYGDLSAAAAEAGAPVAVRSSATTEDTKEASFAGQHDTFLNQRGLQDVVASVRRCWASCFTDRAVEYRNRNVIPHRDAVMSVVVQQMILPSVAGTAFSEELSTGFPAIHITASYGQSLPPTPPRALRSPWPPAPPSWVCSALCFLRESVRPPLAQRLPPPAPCLKLFYCC